MSLVRYEVRDGVAIVTIDNPPVNALSPGVPEGISDAVARAGADSAANAVVLIGAGTTFIAGADINIFKTLRTRAESLGRSAAFHTRLKDMEDVAKPLVAAIHGHAWAAAWNSPWPVTTALPSRVRRSASPGDARHHSWRGWHAEVAAAQSPRHGARTCAQGKFITAPRAFAEGIIDEIVSGDLLDGALAFALARAKAGEVRKTRDLSPRVASRDDAHRGMSGGASDTVEDRTRRPRSAGVRRGDRSGRHDGLRGGVRPRARTVRRLRAVDRVPRHDPPVFRRARGGEGARCSKDTLTHAVTRAAVVGAGTMGGGIAMSMPTPAFQSCSRRSISRRSIAV